MVYLGMILTCEYRYKTCEYHCQMRGYPGNFQNTQGYKGCHVWHDSLNTCSAFSYREVVLGLNPW